MLNIILYIVIIVLIICVVNLDKKIANFKQKENFTSLNDSINLVSIKNLSSLASTIISNNGKSIKLNFKTINLTPFRGMVCPFYIKYSEKIQRQKLLDSYWFPCDGKDGRPDLNSGRFVLGATEDIGKKGGQKTVQLTINEMPTHHHRIDPPSSDGIGPILWGGGGPWNADGGGWHSTGRDTNSVGGNAPHDNMPPYLQISYWIYLPPI